MFALRAARAFTGRPLVAKFEHAYHGTHDTALAWSPGRPAGDLRPGARAAVGRPRWRRAGDRGPGAGGRRDHHRAGPGRGRRPRRRARVPGVPARAERPDRRAARARRGDRVPDRPERRPGPARRGPAGPDDARQDHRRRLSVGGVRRASGRDGPVRRAAPGALVTRRDVQRQPGRRGSGARDAAAPDPGAVRGAGSARGSAPDGDRGGIGRAGLDARVGGVASIFQVFPGPGSVRPTASPRRRRCSSACCSTASISRRAGWARSRCRRPTRTSTTLPARCSRGWPRCRPSPSPDRPTRGRRP